MENKTARSVLQPGRFGTAHRPTTLAAVAFKKPFKCLERKLGLCDAAVEAGGREAGQGDSSAVYDSRLVRRAATTGNTH